MTIPTEQIRIRDPFVHVDHSEGLYYLYGTTDPDPWDGPGTGFDVYRSADLREWDGPWPAFRPGEGFWGRTQFWAPEVIRVQDRFVMFATFAAGDQRGTQSLVSDSPLGPFHPWSDGPLTPRAWSCLDGSPYLDPVGQWWLVFCHEWTQIGDGTVDALRLTPDLRAADSDPVTLFRGSAAPWAQPPHGHPGSYVTDGPYLLPGRDHKDLTMLWSGYGAGGYTLGLARSESGILGPWVQDAEPLLSMDAGHAMAFTDLTGTRRLALHAPNRTPTERAIFPLLPPAPVNLTRGVANHPNHC